MFKLCGDSQAFSKVAAPFFTDSHILKSPSAYNEEEIKIQWWGGDRHRDSMWGCCCDISYERCWWLNGKAGDMKIVQNLSTSEVSLTDLVMGSSVR